MSEHLEEVERENKTLRRLVTELVMDKRRTQPGNEMCALLEVPLPCECGAILWQHFLLHPTPFLLTVGCDSLKAEGVPKEISLHGITVQDGKVCCAACGREVKQRMDEMS